MTFFKVAACAVKDTVIVMDAHNVEITRFTASWRRRNKSVRQALLDERIASLRELAELSKSGDMDSYRLMAEAMAETGNKWIIDNLQGWDGLLDANDECVDFSSDALKEALDWTEYSWALIESLMRVASGNAVELAQAKNSVTPVGTGVTEPSAEAAI